MILGCRSGQTVLPQSDTDPADTTDVSVDDGADTAAADSGVSTDSEFESWSGTRRFQASLDWLGYDCDEEITEVGTLLSEEDASALQALCVGCELIYQVSISSESVCDGAIAFSEVEYRGFQLGDDWGVVYEIDIEEDEVTVNTLSASATLDASILEYAYTFSYFSIEVQVTGQVDWSDE